MATYLLIRHKVQDFKIWKAAFDAHGPMRTQAGLTENYLLRNSDDPNEVVALFEAIDLARARAFVESTDLRQKMQEAGVLDKPDIYFLND
ncbi:cyclase [Variovorax sp. WS11]|uniref:cyclase n=1 Tax=Variovorax sp. WS11 TaxID=1105204 RepID=UPI000D0D8F96|nr:cyclase [Variovorax sp. WS11]NDZ19050.1 cyclase [Variovorax sp. WS11]PSL85025.1 cyclase [Variovorax sp. WS11]